MGNRAVVSYRTQNDLNNNVGVYLHWNGGMDSIRAFLKYCKLKGFRSPEKDNYGLARFIQVVSNYMGRGGLDVGVDLNSRLDLDNGDNGVYLISDWEVTERLYYDDRPEQDEYPLRALLCAIDDAQPEDMRLGHDRIEKMLHEETT